MLSLRPTLCAILLLTGCALHNRVIEDVSADIDRYGSGRALSGVYHDGTRWHALLKSIASGSTASLEVAQRLMRVADAGAAEELELAVGDALARNPSGVLRILNATPKGLACGDVEDDSESMAIEKLNRRRRALMTVRDPALRGPRDACIEAIDAAIRQRSSR